MLSDTALIDLTQAKNYLSMDAAASLHIEAEYVGAGDGETKIFNLDNTPIDGSLRLYVNNVLQVETTDYTISGAAITFVTAPTTDHPITATYDKAASADTFELFDDDLLERLIEAATKEAESYTGRCFVQRSITESHNGNGFRSLRLYRQPIVSVSTVSYKRMMRSKGDGSTVAFSLGYTPKTDSLSVYVDGVLKTIDVDYTLSGQIVTFSAAPADGAELIFKFEVSLVLGSSYFEQIYIGRLIGTWLSNYQYVVTYTTGYGADRAAAQAAVPNVVIAVLTAVANWYENRSGSTSQSVSGVGTATYVGLGLPDASKKLLDSLRVELC